MIIEALKKAQKGEHLSEEETFASFGEIMNGQVESEAILAAFLTVLQMNGPTINEVTGAARALRSSGLKVKAPQDAVDIVGTGGDGLGTFNVSTTAAFIAAGAGVTIAKHGNRGSTSKCGAADCLGALGYNLNASVATVEKCIATVGIGFCFANLCHPAMRYAALVRKTLPYRTIFNILGPITNPAGVTRHTLGVYSPDIIPLYMGSLKALGSKKALVFCGPDGIDELGLAGVSRLATLNPDGSIRETLVDPVKFFGRTYPVSDLAGGMPAENAILVRKVLAGEVKGAYRSAAQLNAAAAIVAGGKAETLEEGLELAAASIDSGRATEKLEAMVRVSQEAS